MGVILNPRGPGGSGKTELTRRIMAAYGWRIGAVPCERVRPIYRKGRRWPIAYALAHPRGDRPLYVIGHYEATSGGCDTIRLTDGGLEEVYRMANSFALSGGDVLFEGLLVSHEVELSAALARVHRLHVLRLNTTVDHCVRNLIARRHTRRSLWPFITQVAAAEHLAIEEACEEMRSCAHVEAVTFEQALSRAINLLGVSDPPESRPDHLRALAVPRTFNAKRPVHGV